MPNIDTMKTSNYLKKEDVGSGKLVTIKLVEEANISKEGNPEELKWLIHFLEFQKPLVSNVTHREQIAAYLSSRESEQWIGKQVVLWNDPSVVFQGKIGAIRIRPAQLAGVQPNQPQPAYEQTQQQQPQNQQPQNFNQTPFQVLINEALRNSHPVSASTSNA